MKEAHFTRGTWRVEESRSGYTVVKSDAVRGAIAHVHYGMPDARLIAGSPKMYGALSQLIDSLCLHGSIDPTREEVLIKDAQNILAIIRGDVE